MISLKFQVFALVLLLIIFVDFLRSKRLPIISTKTFMWFWAASFINISSDLASCYTLTHMNSVPSWLNIFNHQVFLSSLNVVIFLLFLYVCFFSGAQKRFTKLTLFGFSLPCLVSVVLVILLPQYIYYQVDERGAYSHGPTVLISYATIVIYIISIIILLIRKTNSYKKEENPADLMSDFVRARKSVIIGLIICIGVALVQFITKYWLISAMGIALMVMYIYIRFENPREYEDNETNTFSRRAFHIMMPEMFARKKPFYMVNFTIDDVDRIHKVMGYDRGKVILRQAAENISFAIGGTKLYHSRSYTLTAFIEDKEDLDKLASSSELWNFKCNANTADGIFTPNYHLIALSKTPQP